MCVCVFLFYAVGERAETRKPEPGTDYRAGRAELPGYITRRFSLAAVSTSRALLEYTVEGGFEPGSGALAGSLRLATAASEMGVLFALF